MFECTNARNPNPNPQPQNTMTFSHQGLLKISASAGSGKTYTLAKRYIMLLLFEQGADGLLRLRKANNYHSHILAITFTNKATEEMKRRIVKELDLLATEPENSDFWRDFSQMEQKMHCFDQGVLDILKVKQAAQEALASVLYDYGEFNVSTIDSFFQSILRNFARELDRDYNYEVQIDAELAMKVAVHNFLLSLGVDRKRTGGNQTSVDRWVQQYIKQQVDNQKDWNFFKDDGSLFDLSRKLEQEIFRQQMPALHDYLSRQVDGLRVTDLSRIEKFKGRIDKLAKAYQLAYSNLATGMAQLVQKHGVDTNFTSKKGVVYTYMQPDNKLAREEGYTGAVLELTEEKLLQGSFNKMGKKKDDPKYVPPEAFVRDVMQWRIEVIRSYDAWQLLERLSVNLSLLALISRIDDNIKQYGLDTNQVLIADTNDLIARVLDSGVHFIYERVGTWINHFMIDEFQDTSRKQYDNFKPLLQEALSHGPENLCMLIGDAKQSIYRFRNAEPALFRDQVGRDFAQQQYGLHEQTLDTNYRSFPNIVEFNNWLFDRILNSPELSGSDELRATYMPNNMLEDFQQKLHKDEVPGMVRVRFYKGPSRGKAKNKEADERPMLLDRLPQYLLELHKRFEWGQIGILVNVKKDGNKVVERIMQHNKTAQPADIIGIASDESMLLASSPTVRRIVSMLRFIDLTQYRPSDEADYDEGTDGAKLSTDEKLARRQRRSNRYYYHVLGLFMQQMSGSRAGQAGQVLAQCFDQSRQLLNLTDKQRVEAYTAEVDNMLPNRKTEMMTLPNIVDSIIRHSMNDIPPEARETAHLLAFQDCVNDFVAHQGGATVREFLAFWEHQKEKLTVPASASDNSIKVLTIHKSKGLEFDCVVIPFVDWEVQSESGNGPTQPLWVTRDDFVAQGGMELFADDSDITPDMVPPLLPLAKSHLKPLAKTLGTMRETVDRFGQNVLVDNIDKTYVAFTRPRQELHLAVDKGSEVGKMLLDIIQQGEQNGIINKVDEVTYQWGEPCATGQDESQKKKEDKPESINMPAYRVAKPGDKLVVRLPEDVSDKRNTGTRLHNLMGRIAHRRDVERAWSFCLNRGIIGNDDTQWPLERLRAVIDRMFDDPMTCDWFADDNKVYNERNLYCLSTVTDENTGKEKQTLEIYRPDRVVRRPDGTWIVIDYKFGGKEKLEEYKVQVNSYMSQLNSMVKQPVKGYLWFVGLDEIIPVGQNDDSQHS